MKKQHGILFSRDSDERSCGAIIRERINGRRVSVCCMRTLGHEGKHIAMVYDAAKADGVCGGCRQKVGEPHGFFDKKRKLKCYHAAVIVECAFCHQRFGNMHKQPISYTQGLDCAARISLHDGNAILLGYYGSDFDSTAFEFVDGNPIGFETADPVCDHCIRWFVASGALLALPGDWPFGYGVPRWIDNASKEELEMLREELS